MTVWTAIDHAVSPPITVVGPAPDLASPEALLRASMQLVEHFRSAQFGPVNARITMKNGSVHYYSFKGSGRVITWEPMQ